jgi:hypothetical protein
VIEKRIPRFVSAFWEWHFQALGPFRERLAFRKHDIHFYLTQISFFLGKHLAYMFFIAVSA